MTAGEARHESIWVAAPRAHRDARLLAFELWSRGDAVPGLVLADPEKPRALVLVLGERRCDADGLYPWYDAGFAVAGVDLPLLGSRRSPKLTARVLGQPEGGDAYEEWLAQARGEIDAVLDALAGLAEVRSRRVAVCASGAAQRAASWLANDPRVCALVLQPGAPPEALARASLPTLRERLL